MRSLLKGSYKMDFWRKARKFLGIVDVTYKAVKERQWAVEASKKERPQVDGQQVFLQNKSTKLQEAVMKPLWALKKAYMGKYNGDKKDIRLFNKKDEKLIVIDGHVAAEIGKQNQVVQYLDVEDINKKDVLLKLAVRPSSMDRS